MAIAWWIDTGIHFKMAADIRAEYASLWNKWLKPKIRDETRLGLSHVAPSIIILGVATFFSIIAFAFEIVHHLCKQNKIKKKRRMQMQLKRTRGQPKKPTIKQSKVPKKGQPGTSGGLSRQVYSRSTEISFSKGKGGPGMDMTQNRGMKRKKM